MQREQLVRCTRKEGSGKVVKPEKTRFEGDQIARPASDHKRHRHLCDHCLTVGHLKSQGWLWGLVGEYHPLLFFDPYQEGS